MYKDLLKRAMFKTNGCVKVLSLGWQVWSEGDSACREETTCLGAKTQIFGSFIKQEVSRAALQSLTPEDQSNTLSGGVLKIHVLISKTEMDFVKISLVLEDKYMNSEAGCTESHTLPWSLVSKQHHPYYCFRGGGDLPPRNLVAQKAELTCGSVFPAAKPQSTQCSQQLHQLKSGLPAFNLKIAFYKASEC